MISSRCRKRLGTTRGFIAVKPNCSIQSYTPALAAWMPFEPVKAIVSTYQAISGAGKNFESWPEMVGNIIPYIGGEEEKSEKEPLKVFGHIEGDHIETAVEPLISAQCIRVPILNGHTATCFVSFRQHPTKEQLIDALRSFQVSRRSSSFRLLRSSLSSIWRRMTVRRCGLM